MQTSHMGTDRIVLEGDCREVMRAMAAQSVDAIVTDPPYGVSVDGRKMQGQVSQNWHLKETHSRGFADNDGPAFDDLMGGFARESLRIAKPGARLVSFGSPRTYHRLAVAIEGAGWVLQDCLMWLYASGFPKSKTTLKPAWEPILLARTPGKSLPLNIDACRLPCTDKKRFAVGDYGPRGLYGADGVRTADPHPEARFPANLLLDEATAEQLGDNARFFYCAKSSAAERRVNGKKNPHPTVKPIALMRWLLRLVVPAGGTVVDPFAGSGTTGVACLAEGLPFLGIEKDSSYAEVARARLVAAG